MPPLRSPTFVTLLPTSISHFCSDSFFFSDAPETGTLFMTSPLRLCLRILREVCTKSTAVAPFDSFVYPSFFLGISPFVFASLPPYLTHVSIYRVILPFVHSPLCASSPSANHCDSLLFRNSRWETINDPRMKDCFPLMPRPKDFNFHASSWYNRNVYIRPFLGDVITVLPASIFR